MPPSLITVARAAALLAPLACARTAPPPAPPPDAVASRPDPALRARIVDAWSLPGVHAASALAPLGDRVAVAMDDADAWVLLDPATRSWTRHSMDGGGAPKEKPVKSDWEAAFADREGVMVLGSGSNPQRCRVARVRAASTPTELRDAAPLYAAVGAALQSTPNIEGAVRIGEAVRLFHRGVGRGARSATVDVPTTALAGGAAAAGPARWHDLGSVGGVALAFGDALALAGGAILYVAVAEDAPNPIDDGPILGVALGVLEGGAGRFTPLLDPDGSPTRRKAEGLALDREKGVVWMVTDPDDATRSSELLRVVLEGPWPAPLGARTPADRRPRE